VGDCRAFSGQSGELFVARGLALQKKATLLESSGSDERSRHRLRYHRSRDPHTTSSLCGFTTHKARVSQSRHLTSKTLNRTVPSDDCFSSIV